MFGLVHGAGFANYLRSLFVEPITVPLLGFNAGIELGQLVVLGVVAALFALLDGGLVRVGGRLAPASPFRLRVVGVSAAAALVATAWAVQRSPWPGS